MAVRILTLRLLALAPQVSDSGNMTSPLAMATYYGLIKLLATCASGSPNMTHTLLQVSRMKPCWVRNVCPLVTEE